MSRRPRIPRELASRPFTLEEARTAGLTLSCLKGRSWRRIGHQLYCRRGVADDPLRLLFAWRRLLGGSAVFAGSTAAWLHGLDTTSSQPVEVIVPVGSAIRSRAGLIVHRAEIDASEIVSVRGLAATGIHRTLWDLCRGLTPVEALVAIDMAVAKPVTDKEALRRYANGLGRSGGAARLRTLVALAEPAESPMETRLRWLLIQSGLPDPEVQRELRDDDGQFVGRADLFFPASSLVVEYEKGPLAPEMRVLQPETASVASDVRFGAA